ATKPESRMRPSTFSFNINYPFSTVSKQMAPFSYFIGRASIMFHLISFASISRTTFSLLRPKPADPASFARLSVAVVGDPRLYTRIEAPDGNEFGSVAGRTR